MTEPGKPAAGPQTRPDGWLIVLYGLLLVLALALVAVGLVRTLKDNDDLRLLASGVLGIIITTALYPVAAALSAAARARPPDQLDDQMLSQLQLISDRMLLSDGAKRIAYRQKDRQALRQAIREDIDKEDFDAALALVEQMSNTFGYRVEAEQFRAEVLTTRTRWVNQRIDEAMVKLDQTMVRHDWDATRAEACRIQELFADSPRVKGLTRRVDDAHEQHKHELERAFLEAAGRDDLEQAMQLLREMDTYLSEPEAEPFREVARGVITKQRTNLGVKFKMAVHEQDWSAALLIGEEIAESFPNSKMATEIHNMNDLLQARAAGS